MALAPACAVPPVRDPDATRPVTPLHWVLDAPAGPPTSVTADAVGAAAWYALRRDGVVQPVWGDLARPGDAAETPAVRALSLSPLVPERGVVARGSAAWVHTGHDTPARVDVLVPARARRPDPHPLRIACEAELEDGDVIDLGPVRVTSVQRTGIDVARLLPADQARTALRALVRIGLDAGAALERLQSMSGQRGVVEGRRLLQELVRP